MKCWLMNWLINWLSAIINQIRWHKLNPWFIHRLLQHMHWISMMATMITLFVNCYKAIIFNVVVILPVETKLGWCVNDGELLFYSVFHQANRKMIICIQYPCIARLRWKKHQRSKLHLSWITLFGKFYNVLQLFFNVHNDCFVCRTPYRRLFCRFWQQS